MNTRSCITGNLYQDLKYLFLISPQALGKIIPETCPAINEVLRDYIKVKFIYSCF